MRIWLLALASCWTGPVAPPPVAATAPAAPVIARPTLKPGGYFVPNLIAHRLETRAFDGVEIPGGTFAVFESGPTPGFFGRRADASSATSIQIVRSPFTATIAGGDARLVVEYCIDVTGRVTSAHVAAQGDTMQPPQRTMGLTKDQSVLEQLRGWRFAPYFVDGKPVMACSFVDYSAIAP